MAQIMLFLSGTIKDINLQNQTIEIASCSRIYQGAFNILPENIFFKLGLMAHFKGIKLDSQTLAISEISWQYPVFEPVGWDCRHKIFTGIYYV